MTELQKNEMITSILEYITKKIQHEVKIEDLVKLTGKSRVLLTAKFKEEMGMTPIKFFWLYKTMVTAMLVNQVTDVKVYKLSLFMNFKNNEHFCRKVKEVFGMRPTELRARDADLLMRDMIDNRLINNMKLTVFLKEIYGIRFENSVELLSVKYQAQAAPKSKSNHEIKNFVRMSAVERFKLRQ